MKNKTPNSSSGKDSDEKVVTSLHARRETASSADADLELLAQQLERLKQHLDELPEVDATRVIQIHNRLQAGDYQVDASSVAEKLMALEASLQDPPAK